MEYTVLGDTVNTTARIEALNKELGTRLLVSEETRARLSDPNRLRAVGTFELRGRSRPVELYTPEALVPARV
jgi:class 3 adenylate cyclase